MITLKDYAKDEYGLNIGPKKARMILENLPAIEDFVRKHYHDPLAYKNKPKAINR